MVDAIAELALIYQIKWEVALLACLPAYDSLRTPKLMIAVLSDLFDGAFHTLFIIVDYSKIAILLT